jgi:hypothetical protein
VRNRGQKVDGSLSDVVDTGHQTTSPDAMGER